MEKGQFKYGSIKNLKLVNKYLLQQKNLISVAYLFILKKESKKWSVLIPLIYSIVDSYESLIVLSKYNKKRGLKLRDSLVISRTILETILNAIFILCKGEKIAEKAEMHFIQRSFREFERELNIDGQVLKKYWTGKKNLEDDPKIKKALNEFTTNKGREIPQWAPENPVQKLKAIHKKYGSSVTMFLQPPLFSIYRLASEIAHGSFYGAMEILGFADPNRPKNELEGQQKSRSHLILVLTMIFFSGNALLKVLGKELPDKKLVSMNKKFFESLMEEKSLKNVC